MEENNVNIEEQKQKRKELFKEILRFLIVGGLATVFDYLAFFLFREVLLPKNSICLGISTAIGFIVGLIVNYILSIIYVYKNGREKGKSVKAFIIFTIVGVIGLLITEGGMYLGDIMYFYIDGTYHGMPEILMKCIMTGIVLVWNYVGRKILIFK